MPYSVVVLLIQAQTWFFRAHFSHLLYIVRFVSHVTLKKLTYEQTHSLLDGRTLGGH